MSSEVVTLAERYMLEEPLAKGGMATVWRARDQVLARRVAVKVLHPHLVEDSDFVGRFKREALAAARLTHPSIVAIYDTGEEEIEAGPARHYIVMEYCGGGTLADLLGEQGSLPPDRAVGIGTAICEALGYAHRQGVVHRDVKPANVLISDTGALKVGDFGIAKAAFDTTGADVTTTGSILGTVTYLSPEQAQGREPDARSDLYSLGVLLYEALCGRPPFSGETQIATAMMHVHQAPPRLRGVKADVPKQLEAVVMRALAKDPDDRYSSAEDMAAALQRAGDRGSVAPAAVFSPRTTTPVDTEPEPVPQISSDLRWIAPVLVLIAAGALVAWLVSSLVSGSIGRSPAAGGGGSNGGTGTAHRLQVVDGFSFDPYGDTEHDSEVPLAFDGNASTAWTTEHYQDSLRLIGKPGVGIVLDLGSPKKVSRAEVDSAAPGYSFQLRAADTTGDTEKSFDVIDTVSDASASEKLGFRETTARYWLVWITALPGGEGGQAEINEVSFFGP